MADQEEKIDDTTANDGDEDRIGVKKLVHRPHYHFQPKSGWMNDPNGLLHWKGEYHLFYQHNPNGGYWDNISWGHARTRDLVHWIHEPIAMVPTPGSYDEDGCYSGCAVDNCGVPTFIYTGVRGDNQLPCLATGSDDLVTWTKYPGNPVISSPPKELDTVMFRDHSVWNEAGVWYQVIGSGIRDVGGVALLYRSRDLIKWDFMHPLCVGDKDSTEPMWTGTMWECPNFFALDGTYVLLVSVHDFSGPQYAAYMTGDYIDHRFAPSVEARLDAAPFFYAPQTLVDASGRRIMWGWLKDGRSTEAQVESGWSGVISLPRLLSTLPDGRLGQQPARELEILRAAHHTFSDIPLATTDSDRRDILSEVRGDSLELKAALAHGSATSCGLRLRYSPHGDEETLVVYDAQANKVGIDTRHSSLDSSTQRDVWWMESGSSAGEPIELHVFVDACTVEVFVNNSACAAVVYPTNEDSVGVGYFARGGEARIISLDVWELESITQS